MRRLMTSIAAMCLLSGAVGCCKHMAGTCDCDCCPYGCCGCYGCFEGCGCCCPAAPPTVPYNGMPGDPMAYQHGAAGPMTPYTAAQPVYPQEYVSPAPRMVEPAGKVVTQPR
jgi:hypothetical protein